VSRSAAFVSRRVFIDTSAYYALTDPREIRHVEARGLALALTVARRPQFTSNFVLAETHALALSHLGRDIAAQLVAELVASATTIVRVSAADERRAQQILEQYTDKSFSYTDATSFAVMERLHIAQVFTFDDDFSQYGLIRLSTALLGAR
jgi:predicted nucleic acid-binding protein